MVFVTWHMQQVHWFFRHLVHLINFSQITSNLSQWLRKTACIHVCNLIISKEISNDLNTDRNQVLKPLVIYFCRGGQISSECLAGYWCKSGSSNNLINRTMEFQNCSANQDCSGLCPQGHYCPQGVDLPVPCPEHTYRDTEGAESPDQCSPCPAGFYCPSGNERIATVVLLFKGQFIDVKFILDKNFIHININIWV